MKRLFVLWMFFFGVAPMTAAAAGVNLAVTRTELPVHLDGFAYEDFWGDAESLSGFSVYEPNTGLKKEVDASAKIVLGKEALYFFVSVKNGDASLFAPFEQRDSARGDRVEIQLDPYGTGRRGYLFEVNPRGVLADARLSVGKHPDYAWDSLFDAAVSIGEGEWSAEIRIPFQSLRFDPGDPVWLVHIFARSWEHQQSITWVPIDRGQSNWLVQGARVSGFGSQRPGRAIEAMPTLTTSWEQGEGGVPSCDYGATPGSFQVCGAGVDYGVGLKWGMTPSLTLDAVFNPDFSQVEADPGILDLNSRFSIRLDERRPFFLEGADIFATDLEVFYTRSVVQPDFALKLTGKEGAFSVGALAAIDPLEGGGAALTEVVRIQGDPEGDATLGFIFIERDELRQGKRRSTNSVVGVDGQGYFWKRLNLQGEVFASRFREDEEGEATDLAGRARVVWKTDEYRVQAHYKHVGEEFRSDAGFIPRVGYHEGFVKLDGYYRSDHFWARNVSPGIWLRTNVGEDGELQDRVIGMNTFWRFGKRLWTFLRLEHLGEAVEYEGEGGTVNSLWMEATELVLHTGVRTFQFASIEGGVSVGETPIRDVDLWALVGENRPFLGWYYNPSLELTLRPNPRVMIQVQYRHAMFMDGFLGRLLGEQPIYRGVVQGFFTRDLNLRYISQWQPQQEELTNDILLSYTPGPGQVLYIGYRQTDFPGDSSRVERALFLKGSLRLDY